MQPGGLAIHRDFNKAFVTVGFVGISIKLMIQLGSLCDNNRKLVRTDCGIIFLMWFQTEVILRGRVKNGMFPVMLDTASKLSTI